MGCAGELRSRERSRSSRDAARRVRAARQRDRGQPRVRRVGPASVVAEHDRLPVSPPPLGERMHRAARLTAGTHSPSGDGTGTDRSGDPAHRAATRKTALRVRRACRSSVASTLAAPSETSAFSRVRASHEAPSPVLLSSRRRGTGGPRSGATTVRRTPCVSPSISAHPRTFWSIGRTSPSHGHPARRRRLRFRCPSTSRCQLRRTDDRGGVRGERYLLPRNGRDV